MKKFLVPLFSLALISISCAATAQQNKLTSKSVSTLVSDKGYWVIESNVRTPKNAVVHFYTINNTLMYSEKVDGINLDTKRRKTILLLNRALLQTLLTWQKEEKKKQDQQLVKNMITANW